MKTVILLLAVSAAALGSCNTAYKTTQTPDDVYFSPLRPVEERTARNDDDQQRDDSYYEDRYLRMKVHNYNRWSTLDDWYYDANQYRYTSYNYAFGYNPWTPYTYWNSYYNPNE